MAEALKKETCESNIFLAKVSEQAERYDDMVCAMSKVVRAELKPLTVEGRNLLSVAYKNVVGTKRTAWKIIDSIESKEIVKTNKARVLQLKAYKKEIEKEVSGVCAEMLKLLDDHLIKTASGEEDKVFYLKLKGDYYRYLSEIQADTALEGTKKLCLAAYESATDHAKQLPNTNPIRLGLALNFSVFHYEIMKDSDKACKMAKDAFDQGVSELENISEESSKEATLIMELLRDNLQLWNDEKGEKSEEDE